MRMLEIAAVAAILVTAVIADWTAKRYYDADSGITYSSMSVPGGMTYRIALPASSSSSDAIVQIVAPNTYTWCGVAWGGTMTQNPLSVSWPTKQTSGQAAIFSSRWANSYSLPAAYSGASYSALASSPSKTNGTHWTATARCQGCTTWSGGSIDGKSSTRIGYACSKTAISNPTSNTTSFSVHADVGGVDHDLTIARNASYATWVA